MNWKSPTRRNVLTGLGASGALSLGSLAVLAEPSVGMQHEMELGASTNQTEESDLLVEWVETYRGDVQETGSVTTGPNGPVISLQNVLPGDYGSLCIKLTAQGSSAVDPRFSFQLNEEMTGENGLNEPERKAGDTTAAESELQDMVDVEIWYDNGLAGIEPFGSQNCSKDFGEALVDPDASGTIPEVSAALSDGISLTDECLGQDESVRIAFRWAFAADSGVNRTQSDRVGFDLAFGLESCSEA